MRSIFNLLFVCILLFLGGCVTYRGIEHDDRVALTQDNISVLNGQYNNLPVDTAVHFQQYLWGGLDWKASAQLCDNWNNTSVTVEMLSKKK